MQHRADLQASKSALERFFAEAVGASAVAIERIALLAGGAIRQNWAIDAEFQDGPLAGRQALVLRTDAPTGIPSSLGRVEEFAVQRAVFAAGVAVAEPLFACGDAAVIGRPFFVMRRVPGTAQGRHITTALAPELPRLAERLGRELARLQTIRPAHADLPFLAQPGVLERLAGFRAYLDGHPRPRPVLEWALRWLATHIPEPLPPVLCHGDFRTGNYLIDGGRLTAILDWEFAGWGDPDEDIGWFCCKGWRFARLDREAGGIAGRDDFYRGYEAASGRRLDPARVRYWEIFANVRWAVIALQQSDRHLSGGERSLSLAMIGRRATECELELMMLLDPEGRPGHGPPASCRQAGAAPALRIEMRDLPDARELLGLGADLLIEEWAPLLPAERRREAHLVAAAARIAAREAAAGEGWQRDVAAELAVLYDASPLSLSALQGGEGGDPLRSNGKGEVGTRERDSFPHLTPALSAPRGGEGEDWRQLFARFAADLRRGGFETSLSQDRAARAILWRLTIAKLREGNPDFLAANGFANGIA